MTSGRQADNQFFTHLKGDESVTWTLLIQWSRQ